LSHFFFELYFLLSNNQRICLSDQASVAAKRAWRSKDVPIEFWDSYREDARAALSLASDRIPTAEYEGY